MIKREINTSQKKNFTDFPINDRNFSKPKYNSFKSNKNTIKIDPELVVNRKSSHNITNNYCITNNYWNEKIDFNSKRTPIKISEPSNKKLYSEKLKFKLASKFN